ncbi:hypothetical protein N0H69_18935 [Yersinia alsatica]|uniref:Uncharacterized protein n=1 Tax=Yersinia alsatica TaxID=2890317 RepID=A0ABY5US64_9GAMM|nr:hypothetical protein [Yersinia alsatica]OWF68916.1 hypothetical protein B4901_10065 [Yersinia frederiksenii]UWM44703.1 hypothetical protein N0H69_18935 [Yersinia alsatica]CNK95535.1 Uncharacterised protein [Yersinia frederiksenii]CNL71343.1 Uncharacterised protein [Yersinia frederiksenii]
MNKLTEQDLRDIEDGAMLTQLQDKLMAAELLDLRSWKKTAVMCTNELAAVSSENRKLREELAAIKGGQQPIGKVVLSDYDNCGYRQGKVVCLHDQADWDNFADGTLLYLHPEPKE